MNINVLGVLALGTILTGCVGVMLGSPSVDRCKGYMYRKSLSIPAAGVVYVLYLSTLLLTMVN